MGRRTLLPDGTTTPADPRPAGPVERFDPELLRDSLVEVEHLLRYHWAATAAAGRAVLDAGCGTGYGSLILSQAGASSCVGIDISEDAIARARESHSDETQFEVGDLTDLSLASKSFDLIACFETIEHVAESDQERVVAELARVLRPDGLLLISSPNRGVYPEGNPHHLHELTAEELRELLSRHFAEVSLARQHNWITGAVLDDETFEHEGAESGIDVGVRKLHAREAGQELYTLAVCGHGPIEVPQQQMLLAHGLEVRRWLEELERQAKEIDDKTATILRLGDELTETRRALSATEQQLLELRDQRSVAMGQLERKAYWLERAEIDPDALMRRRPFRLAFRAMQFMLRIRRRLGRRK
jgi:ubiquinone/menaquinone biosynthesis C-methylase UbiE